MDKTPYPLGGKGWCRVDFSTRQPLPSGRLDVPAALGLDRLGRSGDLRRREATLLADDPGETADLREREVLGALEARARLVHLRERQRDGLRLDRGLLARVLLALDLLVERGDGLRVQTTAHDPRVLRADQRRQGL